MAEPQNFTPQQDRKERPNLPKRENNNKKLKYITKGLRPGTNVQDNLQKIKINQRLHQDTDYQNSPHTQGSTEVDTFLLLMVQKIKF